MTATNWFEQVRSDTPDIPMEDLEIKEATTEEKDLAALTLTATPRHSIIGSANRDMSTSQICATIQARELPDNDDDQRAPVDVIVVMDLSASMEGEKLALCKTSLELLLRSLLPSDRFGLVTFSDDAVVEIPIQTYDSKSKEKVLRQIKSLGTRCSTNISAAIGLAANEMRFVEDPNPVRTLFLLTDGLANQGLTRSSDLVALTKKHCLAQSPKDPESLKGKPNDVPTTLHCFGYGSDHDSQALQAISQATPGGSYYFVENDSNVLTAFGDALGGVFSVVAQNVVMHIAVPPESKDLGVDIVKVYHKKAVERSDKSYIVSVGDFYAEESRDILFEVKLAQNAPKVVDYWVTHATVSLSYTDTLSMEPAKIDPVPCDIARIADSSAVSNANPHVKIQWWRIRVTEVIANADKLSRRGSLVEARSIIENMLEAIQLSTDDVRSDPLVQQLVVDLNRCKEGLANERAYTQYGTHRMQNVITQHGTQRCMESAGTGTFSAYRSSAKTKTTLTFSGLKK